jgi:hypothetical protein
VESPAACEAAPDWSVPTLTDDLLCSSSPDPSGDVDAQPGTIKQHALTHDTK